jgi:hypothetical protein
MTISLDSSHHGEKDNLRADVVSVADANHHKSSNLAVSRPLEPGGGKMGPVPSSSPLRHLAILGWFGWRSQSQHFLFEKNLEGQMSKGIQKECLERSQTFWSKVE